MHPAFSVLAARTRFELATSALRGRRPKPLDDGPFILAGMEGVEPPLTEPESAVLPLDDTPVTSAEPCAARDCILRNQSRPVKRKRGLICRCRISVARDPISPRFSRWFAWMVLAYHRARDERSGGSDGRRGTIPESTFAPETSRTRRASPSRTRWYAHHRACARAPCHLAFLAKSRCRLHPQQRQMRRSRHPLPRRATRRQCKKLAKSWSMSKVPSARRGSTRYRRTSRVGDAIQAAGGLAADAQLGPQTSPRSSPMASRSSSRQSKTRKRRHRETRA